MATTKLLRFFQAVLLSLLLPAIALATPQNFTGFELGVPSTAAESNLNGGTFSIQSTTKRTGGFALQTNPTTTAVGWWSYALNGATGAPTTFSLSDIYVRFAFRYATKASSGSEEFFGIRRSGGEQATLRLNSSGLIEIYQDGATTLVTTGTAALSANTWYFLKVRIQTSTTGAYTVGLYDSTCTLVENLTGTANFGSANSEGVRFGKITNRNGNTVDYFYDDAITDNSTLPDCGANLAMLPDGAGSSTQWTAGTSSLFSAVDDIPVDDDTSYIQSSGSAADLSLFSLQDTGTVGISGTINGVKSWAYTRENTSVTSATKVRIRANATNTDNTTGLNGTTAYSSIIKIQPTDPSDSNPWTTTDLDGMEVGVIEANAVAVRASTLSVMVDFTAATPTPTPTPTATPTNTPTPVPGGAAKQFLMMGVG